MKKTRHFEAKLQHMFGTAPDETDEQQDKRVACVDGVTYLLHQDERDAVVKTNEDAVYETMDLLFKVDPMFLPYSRAEYFYEAVDLVVNLKNCSTLEDVRVLFVRVFEWWFGENSLEAFDYEMIPAEELLQIKLDKLVGN